MEWSGVKWEGGVEEWNWKSGGNMGECLACKLLEKKETTSKSLRAEGRSFFLVSLFLLNFLLPSILTSTPSHLPIRPHFHRDVYRCRRFVGESLSTRI